MAARKVTAAHAKAARQKKIVIGGSVLLAVILVIQVPRMMKQLNGSATTAAPAPAVTPPPIPTPGATSVGAVPVSAAQANTKLVSFEHFGSKDPFIQQVSASDAASPSSGAKPAKSATSSSSGSGGGSGSTSGSGSTASASIQQTSFKVDSGSNPPAEAEGNATIQINGKSQRVAAGKTFPQADPVFQLVSVTTGSAEIAIAGGSLKGGGKTITLSKGTPLTLLNTADGKRYKLLLVSTSG
jgi:hypothetical protein